LAELVGVAQPIARCGEVGGKGRWSLVSQRGMRPPVVVVSGPCSEPAPDVIEAEEQRLVQELVAHPAVEALTVVSQSNVNGGSTQTAGVTPPMTIMFGGPLGQITWEADTWVNSLRNHEMAVCKLIESISSSGQD
jgi:hypothetical protein